MKRITLMHQHLLHFISFYMSSICCLSLIGWYNLIVFFLVDFKRVHSLTIQCLLKWLAANSKAMWTAFLYILAIFFQVKCFNIRFLMELKTRREKIWATAQKVKTSIQRMACADTWYSVIDTRSCLSQEIAPTLLEGVNLTTALIISAEAKVVSSLFWSEVMSFS